MATINLRDFYPFYNQDCFVEVSDEVAEALKEAERMERAYIRRRYYNKAQYSLNAEDGIEKAVICVQVTPEGALLCMEGHCRLCCALNSLPDKQGRRIEAHYILGISRKAIDRAEGVSDSSINEAIKKGLVAMRKFLKEN